MNTQYAWLIWSLLLVGIWLVIYIILKDKDKRREMLIVSLLTSLTGLTEPLFVPAYWNPPSLFNLAALTRFDIESLIFSFGVGGIAIILYELIFRPGHEKMTAQSHHDKQHRYHLWAILAMPIIFIILLFTTKLNPIYISVISLVLGGIATWYCRPDLKKKMIVSAFLFLALYFFYFLTLTTIYPGYVQQVWNFKNISGILITGIPLEELLYAFSFGFMWSSIYEHFTWRKLNNK
jgi:hypothetical protein